ncbi:hypothetical protein ACER0A_007860 [Haloimpatiens sp. FM7315]|uniref:hypothetical protein n=1 Tax=Haloimpatiens sp. FM7315 TaxID=3298609 RepID=UPI0035A39BBC
MDNKLGVSKEYMEKLRKRLDALSRVCQEKYVREELKDIVNNIDFDVLNYNENIEEICEVIASEMKRLKFIDEDLHLKLYILEQDLLKGKITIDKALEFLKNYTSAGEELSDRLNKGNKGGMFL